MSKTTAAERLAHLQEATAKKKRAMEADLRTAEADAREEARQLHQKHLWALARLLDTTGLSGYSVEVLRPHFEAIAVCLTGSPPKGVALLAFSEDTQAPSEYR